ncbi:ATP-binding response regulator [Marinigracilibium pacificum]|uniref:histidine kinase n=1 Tax=Marinigracilibium pacificum TaxID=2729599 RepID=A0A848J7I6_9BACT|nr:hybrid sensor histidine kinase/response regulator [Marinigracilibium pacificum]NMM50359.1 response regulator [Marinigracilibium pacificum]
MSTKILLVDDDFEDYLIIQDLLNSSKLKDFELSWIDNSQDALESFCENSYDIYLLDYRIGEENGLQLLRNAIDCGCLSPIILLTGYSNERLEQEALKAGAADYLLKNDITGDQLYRSIWYSLEKTKLERQVYLVRERAKSPNGILILNKNNQVIYANEAATIFLNVKMSELSNMYLHFDFKPNQNHEVEITTKGGKLGVGEIRTMDINYEGQNATLITIIDITGHKQLQNNLLMVNAKLEKQNNYLRQFAYIASHDLKSPVNNILSLIDLLNIEGKLDSSELELFNALKKASNKLDRSIHEMISLLKDHQEDVEIEDNQVNVEDVFEDIKESLFEQIEKSEAEIETDFDPIINIKYNRVHLRSILLNLITNAIKYRRSDAKLRIKITTGVNEGNEYLEVKDNGMGIDLDLHGKALFGLFTRFNKQIEGSGIGLYSVKSIAESYGGSVAVKSRPGEGAIFRIYLYNKVRSPMQVIES